MTPIVAPLQLNERKPEVANLQNGLLLLIDRQDLTIPPDQLVRTISELTREREAPIYARFTSTTVQTFQQQYAAQFSLHISGNVDEQTAKALNQLLEQAGAFVDTGGKNDKDQWVVRGQVVGPQGPINGMQVTVHDRDLFFRRDLPNSSLILGRPQITAPDPVTAQNGRFELSYTTQEFSTGDLDSTPDLIFALQKDGQAIEDFTLYRMPVPGDSTEVHSEPFIDEKVLVSEQDMILGVPARRLEEVWIFVGDLSQQREPSEYETLWRGLEELVGKDPSATTDAAREAAVCAAGLRMDEAKFHDCTFAARELNWPVTVIECFAAACRLHTAFGKSIPVPVFYGLAREMAFDHLRKLVTATIDTLSAALRAAGGPIIPPLSDDQIRQYCIEIRERAPRLVLDQSLDGIAMRDLLSLGLESADLQAQLIDRVTTHRGSPAEFWNGLRAEDAWKDHVPALQYMADLGAVTQYNVSFMKALKTTFPQATSLRQLALTAETSQVLDALRSSGVSLSTEIPGSSEDERRTLYAEGFLQLLRSLQPTAAAARVIQQVRSKDRALIHQDTESVLFSLVREHEDFDFVTTNVSQFAKLKGLTSLEETTQAYQELTRAQRLFRLSTGEQTFSALLTSGLTSASAIIRTQDRKAFTAINAEAMGGPAEAEYVYDRAEATAAAVLMLALQAARETSAPLADTSKEESLAVAVPPSWARLFGAADSCDCPPWRSWFSPTAWCVDSLMTLCKRTGPPEESTLGEVLFQRRPDLEHFELSFENANIPIPEIDLNNEKLETLVVLNGVLDRSAAHNTPNRTAAELRAVPQYVREDAYEKLRDAVHPPPLPFDRNLARVRIYLNALDIPRHQLLHSFEGCYGNDLADPNEKLRLERAKHREGVAEYFGLSPREAQLITGKDFTLKVAENPVTTLYGISLQTLEAGQIGPLIVAIRAKLKQSGMALELTGPFDEGLAAAVSSFQGARGLPTTGKVDPQTWSALETLTPSTASVVLLPVPELLTRLQITVSELNDLLHCPFINPGIAVLDAVRQLEVEFGLARRHLRNFIKSQYVADTELQLLLDHVGKTAEQLKSAISSLNARPDFVSLIILNTDPLAECDTTKMSVEHIDGTFLTEAELRRLISVVRLWRKTGWSLADLELALRILNWEDIDLASDDIGVRGTFDGKLVTYTGIENLTILHRLAEESSIPLPRLLLLWGEFSVPGLTKLYEYHFHNASLNHKLDPDFALTTEGGVLSITAKRFSEKASMVRTSARLQEADYLAVLQDAALAGPDDTISLSALSTVMRYPILARLAGLTIEQLLTLKRVSGIQPFNSPQATLRLLELARLIPDAGFEWEELRYLFSTIKPNDKKSQVEQAYGQMEAALASSTSGNADPEASIETLSAVLPRFIPLEHTDEIIRLILGQPGSGSLIAGKHLSEWRQKTIEALAVTAPGSSELVEALAQHLFPEPITVDESKEEDVLTRQTRLQSVFAAIKPIAERQRHYAAIIEALASATGTETRLMKLLLQDPVMLKPVLSTSQVALADFLPLPSKEQFTTLFYRIDRASLLLTKAGISIEELTYRDTNGKPLPWVDTEFVDHSDSPSHVHAWMQLARYILLRRNIAVSPDRFIRLWNSTNTSETLSEVTGWAPTVIAGALLATGVSSEQVIELNHLWRITTIIGLARRLGIPPTQVHTWAAKSPSSQQAEEILDVLKSRYDPNVWLEVLGQHHDELREQQRDALVAYVLTLDTIRQRNILTINQLGQYYLADFGANAIVQSARTKNCLDAIQALVTQASMGLIPEIAIASLDQRNLERIMNYQVWAAPRMIAMDLGYYCKDVSLLSKRSLAYQAIQSELQQNPLTVEGAERLTLQYLEQVQQMATLEICGQYWEHDEYGTNILHVFGRTTAGIPRQYYYRRLIDDRQWTPWEALTVNIQGVEADEDNDISGVHLLPVVWKGTLHLFWPQFRKVTAMEYPDSISSSTGAKSSTINVKKPASQWEVKLASSRYEQGRWSSARVSDARATWGNNAKFLGKLPKSDVSPRFSDIKLERKGV